MKTIKGGKPAKDGYYLNLSNREIVTLEKSDLLPGPETTRYVRIPTIAMLIGGPIIGLLYVMFLPFISFAMILSVGAQKIKARFGRAVPVKSEFTPEPTVKVVSSVKVEVKKENLPMLMEREVTQPRKEGLQ